jgi:DNA-binding winged helix-turn-helix (wHTH) protein
MNSSSEHGNSSRAALPQLFFSGRTDEVLKLTVDQAFGEAIATEHWPFVIGALCFKGRIDEADIRFQSVMQQLPDEERVACQFYLGIGFARLSLYGKARALFAQNLSLLRHLPADRHQGRIRFYVWQGIGFFRQLCGRKIQAMIAAQKAWQAAIAADFYFGRMLATELLGHGLIGCGRIARGLRELETAYGLAQNLGHGAYEKAIYRSLLMYKIQFGYPPYDALQTIRELLDESRVANNYSDNALSLELIRQFILRGELNQASRLHEDIGRSIYAERHRRHEIFWHLQAAEIAWLRRDLGAFRESLIQAEAALDPEFDEALQLHILGLRMREDPASYQEPCRRLTRRLGSDIAARILARAEGRRLESTRGEDPLGDILDGLSTPQSSIIQKLGIVLDSPYLGLLSKLLPLQAVEQSLHILMPKGALIIVDRGDIARVDSLVSPQTLDLLRLLSQGWVQKQQLVEAIWGYAYHPLKHDSLVYSLISRVRTQLGAAGGWIEHGPQGYCLRPGVLLQFHNFQPAAPQTPVVAAPQEAPAASASLNSRQLLILEALADRPHIDVEDCVKLFGTSRITASRDLSSLCQEGLVERIGKGRSTKYRLVRTSSQ